MAQHRRRVTDPRHTPTENPALAEAMRLLARSGAAGTHADRRTRRNRDRSAQRRNSIKEQD